ncbi:vomeronasal type-2 receptor 116-like [Heterocephalus glaber]|uniref:Vomeronasal type-2 receptor 116-like n=1 Tax=Heterocephalus glaber TaxID=10181 RepID=A0AAX6SHH8_HETGA|nr:vomeronasal type-2 receptor 116-like [Heterocephalus glaber]
MVIYIRGVIGHLILSCEQNEGALQGPPLTVINIMELISQRHIGQKIGILVDLFNGKNQGQSIQHSLLVCNFENEPCLRRRNTSVYKDGDVVIGGLFSLFIYLYYNGIFYLEPMKDAFMQLNIPNSYQNVLAFLFAIEEINKDPHVLPNISLGYEYHNFLYSHWRMLESSLTLLTGQSEIPNYSCRKESKSIAVLTGTLWATSAQIGTLLELYKFPQVTFGSFDPMLKDSGQFPSVYQIAPKDISLALGMVSLMVHFSWTWVGLVITEGQKGLQFLSDVTGEMDRNKVCVAFVKMVPTPLVSYIASANEHVIMTKETSQVNVVIIYYDTDILNDVNYIIVQYLLTGKVWVTNSQWHADMTGKNFILNSFHGSLIFSNHRENISGFKTFVQEANPSKYPEDFYLTMFWFNNFYCSFSNSDCSLKDCTPNASLAWLPVNRFDTAMTDQSHNIYNAVYAVAHALHEMLLQQAQWPPMGNKVMVFAPWQFQSFLKNIHFNNPAGDQVTLDDKRKLDVEYDILNFWNFPEGLRLKTKLGTFTPHVPHAQQLSLSDEMIEWAMGIIETPRSVCSESCSSGFRKSPQEGKPACCFDCTPCPENEIANDTGMEQCVKCSDDQYANPQQNHCLQKSETFLGHGDPMGKILAGTALSLTILTAAALGLFVKHQDTPIVKANNRALSYTLLISLIFCFLCSLLFIGRPNTATCILQQTTFGVVFTVAISTILAKTVTVVLAFKVTAPGRRMRQLLVSRAPNYIIPICSLIQLTLCGVWMGTNPPYIETDAHAEHGHIIIVCNKGSLTAFYCVLGYLGSLALVSFTVAFLARNLPDTFNEAKFLTFSMLVFCSVWVTFLPVYHSTKGKVMVAMEVFSILASSAGLLGCIFGPKCYIILLRPDRNSLYEFRDKTHSGKKKAY